MIYVGGTFDLFHWGHVQALRRAWEIDPQVVVSVNTDEFAESYKRKPIMRLGERVRMLVACRYVHAVVINHGGADSTATIDGLLEDGWPITKVSYSDGWGLEAIKEQMGITDQWLDQTGIELVETPYSGRISTTEVIERCKRSA